MSKYYNPYKMFIGSFIPNWIMRHKGLRSREKLCYGRLAQYMGADGKCYPSEKSLAFEIGIGKRRIVDVLKELESKGFIEIIPPKELNKARHFHNEYKFLTASIPDAIRCTSVGAVCCTSVKENHIKENHKDKEEDTTVPFSSKKGKSASISFDDYLNVSLSEDTEAKEKATDFITAYENKWNKKHPLLRPKVWDIVIGTLLNDINPEEFDTLIDTYFNMNFRKTCNYSIYHFNSPTVKQIVSDRAMDGR